MITLLLSSLLGCASHDVSVVTGPRAPAVSGVVAVAPASLLADVPGAVADDPFAEGLFVGNVVFSGGYELMPTELGPQTRSKDVALSAQETYTAQVRGQVDALVSGLLLAEGVTGVPAPGLTAEHLPAPHRTPVRGSSDDDGKDNQNLPRFRLAPAPLPADAPVPDGAELVLVPLVVHYYSHNGGWFLGQTFGSASGARMRLMWTLYDADTRQPVSWADIQAREIVDGLFTPNRAQVEDALLAVEERVQRKVARTLRF